MKNLSSHTTSVVPVRQIKSGAVVPVHRLYAPGQGVVRQKSSGQEARLSQYYSFRKPLSTHSR